MSGDLSNDVAMPLALILNELLTNACKHGSRSGGENVVRAGLINDGNAFLLYVEDAGPGFDLAAVTKKSARSAVRILSTPKPTWRAIASVKLISASVKACGAS